MRLSWNNEGGNYRTKGAGVECGSRNGRSEGRELPKGWYTKLLGSTSLSQISHSYDRTQLALPTHNRHSSRHLTTYTGLKARSFS